MAHRKPVQTGIQSGKKMDSSGKDAFSRHFERNQLIDSYYKERDKDPDATRLCIHYCLEDINSIAEFVDAWLEQERDFGKKPVRLPRIPAFERLAIIYEKQDKYQDAIQVCQQAIQLGLDDPKRCYASLDFAKRITKLQKKLASQTPAITSRPAGPLTEKGTES